MIKTIEEVSNFINVLIRGKDFTINNKFKENLEQAYLIYKNSMPIKDKELLNKLCIQITGDHIDNLFFNYLMSFNYDNENQFYKDFLIDYIQNHTDELLKLQFNILKHQPEQFIKERLMDIGCLSQYKDIEGIEISLKEILINELINLYLELKISDKQIRKWCFDKYEEEEAIMKVIEKTSEINKSQIEAMKLLYQIYKDNE